MGGPWEDYGGASQAAPEADGPWADFASASKPSPAQQASKPRLQRPKKNRSLLDETMGFMANVERGSGVLDELGAGAGAAFDIATGKSKVKPLSLIGGLASLGTNPVQGMNLLRDSGATAAYDTAMARQRKIEDEYAADRPGAARVARSAGMSSTMLVPGGQTANVLASSSRGMNALRGAVGAATSAYGYGLADRGTGAERVKAASEAATNPVTIGLGAGLGALGPAAKTPRPDKPKPMSLEELQTAKQGAYKAVEESGARYSPQAFDGMVDNLTADAQKAKINPMRHPKAASMLEELQSLKGSSPTLTEIDQLRQVIRRDVASANDEAEAYFGQRMIAGLDDFMSKADDSAMVSGSAEGASGLIRNARDLNTRFRKVEAVTDAVDSAKLRAGSTGSGGNADNATRQNLRRVLENTRNLTDEEKAALESIVMGSKGQNVLRQVGKLSPQGNGLMAAGNLAAAASMGPLGAIPGTAGLIAKHIADGMTQRKVDELLKLMSTGGSTAERVGALQEFSALAARDPGVAALQKAIAARLSRAAGIGVAASQAGARPTANLLAQP